MLLRLHAPRKHALTEGIRLCEPSRSLRFLSSLCFEFSPDSFASGLLLSEISVNLSTVMPIVAKHSINVAQSELIVIIIVFLASLGYEPFGQSSKGPSTNRYAGLAIPAYLPMYYTASV